MMEASSNNFKRFYRLVLKQNLMIFFWKTLILKLYQITEKVDLKHFL